MSDYSDASKELYESDLQDIEVQAFEVPDSITSHHVQRLVIEVRKLRMQLIDPNFMYSGRIPRQAILCRNAEIDRLRAEIHELKKPKEAT